MVETLTRRDSFRSLAVAALAAAMHQPRGASASDSGQSGSLAEWVERIYANTNQLRSEAISGLRWQEVMDGIYRDASIPELKRGLDFENLRCDIIGKMTSERGELFQSVSMPLSKATAVVKGREPHRKLIAKVAHIKKGRSIPPHGHSNMASAFLCISGEFEVRQYDKLEETAETMVLRQTVHEKRAGVGTWSSISDYRDNVHWLTANTDDCFLFTTKVIGIESARPLNGRINVDVHRAHRLGSNTIAAPKITFREAAELY